MRNTLSTPHGGLKTLKSEEREKVERELSTPHGGLKT